MPEADSYDAVVLGAGHNGLVLAAYLQRAGLRTLLLEQHGTVGGMSCTVEPMGPGFRHNPHANFLAYQAITPIVADLRLQAHGLETLTPDVQHGIAFADGRAPVVIHRTGCEEATARSFARFSTRDAATVLALRPAIEALTPVIRELMFHPLTPANATAHREAVASAFGAFGISRPLGTRGAAAVIDELFEAEEIRTLMCLLAVEYGAALTQPGNDLGFLGFTLWLIGNRQVARGGTQSFADALHRAALAEGVTVRTGTAATRILVDHGAVTGVEMAGQRVKAPLVASSIGIGQTLRGLLDPAEIGAADAQALIAFQARKGPIIASQAFALREPPRYRSAARDADINHCIQTFIGFDNTGCVRAHEHDLALGLLPAARASVRVPSLWDASLAPAGFHIAGADSHFPDADSFSTAEWQDLEATYNAALLDTWQAAAPNMTAANVQASHFSSPRAGDRQVLLRERGSHYQTSIKGLFLCGTSTYPGGGVHGACAINAFQDITGVRIP